MCVVQRVTVKSITNGESRVRAVDRRVLSCLHSLFFVRSWRCFDVCAGSHFRALASSSLFATSPGSDIFLAGRFFAGFPLAPVKFKWRRHLFRPRKIFHRRSSNCYYIREKKWELLHRELYIACYVLNQFYNITNKLLIILLGYRPRIF